MSRRVWRRFSQEFKVQVCTDVATGAIGRREAQRRYRLSSALLHAWLDRYENGEPDMKPIDSSVVLEYEAKIASLERKVGQLVMELDLLKKTKRQHPASGNVTLSVISGPKAAPSDGDAT